MEGLVVFEANSGKKQKKKGEQNDRPELPPLIFSIRPVVRSFGKDAPVVWHETRFARELKREQ